MEKIFYNAGLTEIEYLIIENIKALRKERNMSKQELSKKMGVAISFIGKAENYAFREKYSVRHLALAAKALGLQSVKEWNSKNILSR
jgi:transcriptional regulator with XRE-family HTH domain